jgi:hypothetical protein
MGGQQKDFISDILFLTSGRNAPKSSTAFFTVYATIITQMVHWGLYKPKKRSASANFIFYISEDMLKFWLPFVSSMKLLYGSSSLLKN